MALAASAAFLIAPWTMMAPTQVPHGLCCCCGQCLLKDPPGGAPTSNPVPVAEGTACWSLEAGRRPLSASLMPPHNASPARAIFFANLKLRDHAGHLAKRRKFSTAVRVAGCSQRCPSTHLKDRILLHHPRPASPCPFFQYCYFQKSRYTPRLARQRGLLP